MRGCAILRAAVILRQRDQHTLALVLLFACAAGLHALGVVHGAVEIAARLLDLGVERVTLRRLVREDREKSVRLAPQAALLGDHAVEVALLFHHGVVGPFDLCQPRRIARAAVDGAELGFKPHADRV